MFVQQVVQANIKENIKDLLLWAFEGNPPMTDGFTSQRACNSEIDFMSWRHYEISMFVLVIYLVLLDYGDGTC